MTKPPIHLEERKIQGVKLYSPTAARNKAPLAQALSLYMPHKASVLEIASGTGEQAAYICERCSDLTWQPSDPDADSRASQNSWAMDSHGAMQPSLDIDVLRPFPEKLQRKYDALFCSNMIHIAPKASVAGLAAVSNAALKSGGKVFIYGPFLFGDDSAPSNLAFDGRLKLRDSDWGVRELAFVKHIFGNAGLTYAGVTAMPANNHIVRFVKL